MRKTMRAGIAAGVAALALTGGGAAFAASTSTAPNIPAPKVVKVCDAYGVNVMHLDWNGAKCPSGYYQTTWTDSNGSLAATLADTTAQAIITGGSFVANSTEIGTLTLAPGTYLVTLNAKATPAATAGSAQVFPQFFVYNQAKNAQFTGDEFNAGAGALEPAATNHDSYYSGTGQVTVPAGGETLHVYAFGYDSDSGAGSYTLDNASVSAIRVG